MDRASANSFLDAFSAAGPAPALSHASALWCERGRKRLLAGATLRPAREWEACMSELEDLQAYRIG